MSRKDLRVYQRPGWVDMLMGKHGVCYRNRWGWGNTVVVVERLRLKPPAWLVTPEEFDSYFNQLEVTENRRTV